MNAIKMFAIALIVAELLVWLMVGLVIQKTPLWSELRLS